MTSHEPGRRNVLWGLAALVVGLIDGVVPAIIGLRSYFDPLIGKTQAPKAYDRGSSGADGFLKITTLDAVPADGIPRRFPVISDLSDGWNFSPSQPIGSVYLVRKKGEQTVTVFHSTCPHAGCSVAYTHDPDPKNCLFKCPCHNSAFTADGAKVDLPGKENPIPRPMDTLELDANRLASNKEIWIKFQNFYTGKEEKKAKI